MAVIAYEEVFNERSVTGTWRESYKFTRPFIVRVDHPNTDLYDILSAPGINYLDAHPEFAWGRMQDFTVNCADESGLYYRVTFVYYALQLDNDEPNELPPDVWSASGSVTSGPATVDKDGDPILNSAGDAIEGLEKDYAELRLSLVRCYSNLAWTSVANSYTNTVNASAWAGGAARSWKVAFQSATKRIEVRNDTRVAFWETAWDFVYRDPNWDLKPLNVGMMEKVGGQKKVIKVNGNEVVQPVALNANGTANPNGNPEVINGGDGVRVYNEADFSVFGTPS